MTASVLTRRPSGVQHDPLLDKTYQDTALGPAIVDFLAWFELGGKSPISVDNYERSLARGALLYPDVPLEELTGSHLLQIANAFPALSRRVAMAEWSSFFRWARQTRRVMFNPCEELPKFKRPAQKVIDVFTEAERAALEGLPLRDGALMRLMLSGGLRKGEARRLRYRDVRPPQGDDEGGGELVILSSKGGKDRLVPIGVRTARMVAELAFTEGLEPADHVWYSCVGHSGQIRRRWFDARGGERDLGQTVFVRWWERCVREAGVRYRNPHVTRHTFATNWLRRGGRLEVLSDVLGHDSIATTKDLYGHLDTRDARVELALIESEE